MILKEQLEDHQKCVKCLAKYEDGSVIATGGRDGKIFLYDFRMSQANIAQFTLVGEHFFNQPHFTKQPGTNSARK